MNIKGINYDAGTEYRPGEMSREIWNTDDVVRDMRVIKEELHCNSVNVYGTDLPRMVTTAEIALTQGLAVSYQPRSIDRSRSEMLEWVGVGAAAAEGLRGNGDVTLNVGCETSLFTEGFVPGRSFMSRMRNLTWYWPFLRRVNTLLNSHLNDVLGVARGHFGGRVTYGSGSWESVDWSGFDLVGVNLYRDRWNAKTYVGDLEKLADHGKPVVITEFGCCTFEGAETKGGGGWLIVDFDRDPPVVKPGYTRSERVQARHLDELLGLFDDAGIHGAYVFDFMQAGFANYSDPLKDLDMASYGVVKVAPSKPGDTSIRWERKEAFEVVSRRYGATF